MSTEQWVTLAVGGTAFVLGATAGWLDLRPRRGGQQEHRRHLGIEGALVSGQRHEVPDSSSGGTPEGTAAPGPLGPGAPFGECRSCGCTDEMACPMPGTGAACWWVEDDLCSRCAASSPVRAVGALPLPGPDGSRGGGPGKPAPGEARRELPGSELGASGSATAPTLTPAAGPSRPVGQAGVHLPPTGARDQDRAVGIARAGRAEGALQPLAGPLARSGRGP
jgi:hypothetical protein